MLPSAWAVGTPWRSPCVGTDLGDRPGRFWVSAGIAAAVVAGVVAWAGPLVLRLEPRPGLRPLSSGEFWLLTVFTLGTLAVLLGVAVALGGWFRGSLLREALESVPEENEKRGDLSDEEAEGADPGWWTAAVGLNLLVIYWAGWLLLG